MLQNALNENILWIYSITYILINCIKQHIYMSHDLVLEILRSLQWPFITWSDKNVWFSQLEKELLVIDLSRTVIFEVWTILRSWLFIVTKWCEWNDISMSNKSANGNIGRTVTPLNEVMNNSVNACRQFDFGHMNCTDVN